MDVSDRMLQSKAFDSQKLGKYFKTRTHEIYSSINIPLDCWRIVVSFFSTWRVGKSEWIAPELRSMAILNTKIRKHTIDACDAVSVITEKTTILMRSISTIPSKYFISSVVFPSEQEFVIIEDPAVTRTLQISILSSLSLEFTRVISFRNTCMRTPAVIALFSLLIAGMSPQLESIDISSNPIGPLGGHFIADSLTSPFMRKIKVLIIDKCAFGQAALESICEACSNNLCFLERLIVGGNLMSPVYASQTTVRWLESRGTSPKFNCLQSLSLCNTRLEDIGIKLLANSLRSMKEIRSIDLADTGLTAEGVRILASCFNECPMQQLESLVLSANPIQNEGISILASVITHENFPALSNLMCNNTRLSKGAVLQMKALVISFAKTI